ncbi:MULTISPECIES: hypothetical protein [Burkholderia]|uniref:hypothetical protein n=1 Tax=Burkholderia TaxID=32008 RepID=UPI00025F0674|nr:MULTISPECIES: hypothetical protein [Burkholderia]AFJ89287.1 hypothetical protein MYA_4939 [Burkholderia sp. KJ006]MCA8449289.1 hypothetical protein [Burkholderia vietnamiensis]
MLRDGQARVHGCALLSRCRDYAAIFSGRAFAFGKSGRAFSLAGSGEPHAGARRRPISNDARRTIRNDAFVFRVRDSVYSGDFTGAQAGIQNDESQGQ